MQEATRSTRINPRQSAGFLSALFFWWTFPIFKLGYHRDLEIDDLYAPLEEDKSQCLGDSLERCWQEELQRSRRRGSRPMLFRAIVRSFKGDIMVLGVLLVVAELIVRLAQPLLLGRLLQSLGETSPSTWAAAGIVVCAALTMVCSNHYLMASMRTGMRVRAACCSLIYRKALRLSSSAISHTSPAQAVNLLSHDVSRFELSAFLGHYMWVSPTVGVTAGYLLWAEVGWVSLLGVAVVLAVVVLQAFTSSLTARYRRTTSHLTDQRVRIMDEVLRNINTLKLCVWEALWGDRVDAARRKELSMVRKTSYIRGVYMMFTLCTTRIALYVTLVSLVLSGSDTPPDKVFVIWMYYNIITLTMSMMFIRGIAELTEASVSVSRLEKFLLLDEFSRDITLAPIPHDTHLHDNHLGDTSPALITHDTHLHDNHLRDTSPALIAHDPHVHDNHPGDTSTALLTYTHLHDNHLGDTSLAPITHDTHLHDKHLGDKSPAPIAHNTHLHDNHLGDTSPAPIAHDTHLHDNHLVDISPALITHDTHLHDNHLGDISPAHITQDIQLHDNHLSGISPAVQLTNVSACWDGSDVDTLSGITMTANAGMLVMVVGSVGSGKSSLLQCMLGELPLQRGQLSVQGSVSYCSPCPWVFPGSLRGNVVFSSPWDEERYSRVLEVCALGGEGDLTPVGDRGVCLSGGQRARLALARAVYRDADIYLLDDPLSAVDTHVSKHLFDECIRKFLANKTRILVTHQIHYLEEADHIILIHNGRIVMQGTYKSLSAKVDYGKLLGLQKSAEATVDEEQVPEDEENPNPESEPLLSDSTSVDMDAAKIKQTVRGSAVDESTGVDHMESTRTARQGGRSVYVDYIHAAGGWGGFVLVAGLFLLAQTCASAADYYVSYWAKLEQARGSINGTASTNVDEAVHHPLPSTLTCIYTYSGLMAGLCVSALVRSFCFYTLCVWSSRSLHSRMYWGVVSTSLRFHAINPSGRILNRFSKDMGAVDELLPKAIMDASQVLMMMAGCLVVTMVTNFVFLLPVVGVCGCAAFMRRVYLKTANGIKRVEGVAKSPVFTHIHTTLLGLPTIRACRAEPILKEEFDRHQDTHTASWFLFASTSAAFGLYLDTVCVLLVAVVTFSCLYGAPTAPGVGLAITQTLSMTGLVQWGLRQSAEVDNIMCAVERVLDYTELPAEGSEGGASTRPPGTLPPPSWPAKGEIVMRDVSLRHSKNGSDVIKSINLHIRGGEKVGIVGRTGAGKSSLLSVLLRTGINRGKVMVDGEDVDTLPLSHLRSRIAVIPQAGELFSGTLRDNVDPAGVRSDRDLWEAVCQVDLQATLAESQGLETAVNEAGRNLSEGQRQQVCVVRAIIRDCRVLLVDEATANVDTQTAAVIQRTLRDRFQNCTVLTVSHRLISVIDCDRVIVMGGGRLLEFDHPHVLLQNPTGHFSRLVQRTGKVTAEQLAAIACTSYIQRCPR